MVKETGVHRGKNNLELQITGKVLTYLELNVYLAMVRDREWSVAMLLDNLVVGGYIQINQGKTVFQGT